MALAKISKKKYTFIFVYKSCIHYTCRYNTCITLSALVWNYI